ncbi:MAG: ribonuclease HII [Minwuia sp.]|nr:ribonuclease HII [Minwuia sp.]
MADRVLEQAWRARVGGPVAGVDEVGRGPLAGPVVAAAVILPDDRLIGGLADSKALSARRRQEIAAVLHQDALVSIAEATVAEIDRLNILHAAMLAMSRAIAALPTPAAAVLVDGNRMPPDLAMPGEAVVKGDAKVAAIAAASIVAKVHRDALMSGLAETYPGYGFERHAGYPTRQHRQALAALGPCPVHRRSFQPVRDLIIQEDPINH